MGLAAKDAKRGDVRTHLIVSLDSSTKWICLPTLTVMAKERALTAAAEMPVFYVMKEAHAQQERGCLCVRIPAVPSSWCPSV